MKTTKIKLNQQEYPEKDYSAVRQQQQQGNI